MRDYYSGKGTTATVTTHLNIKLQRKGLCPLDFFVNTHAADKEGFCQSCLLTHMHPKALWPTIRHVFGEFTLDRLSDADEVLKLTPSPDESEDERRKKFEQQADLLFSQPKHYIPFGTKAWCFRHNQPCNIHDEIGWENDISFPYIVDDVLARAGSTADNFFIGNALHEGGADQNK